MNAVRTHNFRRHTARCLWKFYLFLSTSCIWFPLGNLTSSLANHLKFIHKVRDNRRHTKFCFGFSLFWSYARFLFHEAKQGHLYPMITFLLFFQVFVSIVKTIQQDIAVRGVWKISLEILEKISLVYTKVCLMSSIKNQSCIHKGMAYVLYKKSALYTQRYGLCLL